MIPECHDCGAKEGQIHEWGCDMERCPFCGNQVITCLCMYDMLDIVGDTHTEEDEKKFLDLIEEKGRIPYIRYPNLCQKCGTLWPELFHVPDEEWEKYIQPDMRKKIICQKCYDEIKTLILI